MEFGIDADNYSATEECDYAEWSSSKVLIPSIYCLVFFLGTVGNGLVICTIFWKSQEKRRSTDTFIANLAVADLTFVVTLPLWATYVILDYHWPFGSLVCKLNSYLISVNMYASVFCLTGLSFDRYLAIVCRPWTRAQPRSKASGFLMTVMLWVIVALLALPAMIFRNTDILSAEINNVACFMDFSSVATNETETAWETGLGLSSTLMGFVVPFAIMLTCYFFIARTIAGHFRMDHSEGLRKRKRLLIIIIALVVTFALCWLPFHLVKTVYMLMNWEVIPLSCKVHVFLNNLHPYCNCLAYVNSCLNPFLYAFFDPRFRQACSAVLCRTLRHMTGLTGNKSTRYSPGKGQEPQWEIN